MARHFFTWQARIKGIIGTSLAFCKKAGGKSLAFCTLAARHLLSEL
jgi:hypothetical protein